MRNILAAAPTILAFMCFPTAVSACLPVAEAPLPIGLHDSIVGAFEINDVSERENAIEEILREYLAHESREVVHQTIVYLGQHQRWIDLRRYDHLVSSISPRFSLESWLAGRVFDMHQLRQEPLSHRLQLYRAALIDGEVKLPHGSNFYRDDAARHVASSGLTELLPLVEEHFSETQMAIRHEITFSEFMTDYEWYLGGSDWDSAFLLAVERLDEIDECVFREQMNNGEGFREQAKRIFEYNCAENPFTGNVEPSCEYALEIYVRQKCFWFETELKRRESGAEPPKLGPCGSHPVPWLANLERYSFQGQSFKQHFIDAWKDNEGCD